MRFDLVSPGRMAVLAAGLCLPISASRSDAAEPAAKADAPATAPESQPVSLFDAVRDGDVSVNAEGVATVG